MCPTLSDANRNYLSQERVKSTQARIFESELRLLRCEQRVELSMRRILIAIRGGADADVAASGTRPLPPPGWPDLSHLTVLVVEDDKDNRDMLIAFLLACRATVRSASTAAAALHLDSSPKIDLLITDVRLREYGGRKLAQWVREHPKRRAVPIVAVSGSVREVGGDGYDAFLLKPLNLDELAATILRVTPRR